MSSNFVETDEVINKTSFGPTYTDLNNFRTNLFRPLKFWLFKFPTFLISENCDSAAVSCSEDWSFTVGSCSRRVITRFDCRTR